MLEPSSSVPTLIDLVDKAAATDRGLTFITPDGESRVSYRALRERLPRLGAAIRKTIAMPVGHPILWVMPNCEALVVGFFATQYIGHIPAIMAPLRPFGDVRDWADKLARVAIHSGNAPIIAFRATCDMLGASGFLDDITLIAIEDLLAAEIASDAPAERATITPETIAFLQFTSGSLGDPKGVMLSHGAAAANAIDVAARMRATVDDVFLFWVPLVHDMAVISCLSGLAATVDQIMMPTEMFATDPLNWLRLIAQRGATCTSAPPFAMEMARQRLKRTGETIDLSTLRACCTGAEPIDARILRAFSAELLDGRQIFLPAYGMAEMTCVVSAGEPGAPLVTRHVTRPFTPGQPLNFTTADNSEAIEITGNGPALTTNAYRIVDNAGAPLPDGVLGHIELRGACMMSGYWRRSDATDEAFRDTADGIWLRSGDLGFTDAGHIFISGREKEVIIVRGRHFFPEELDALIQTVPGVRLRGVMTFGEVDPSGGPEQVTAVIEKPDGFGEGELASLDRTIRTAVADQLDLNLSRVVFTGRGTLPRTTSGKPRRNAARERWGSNGSETTVQA